MITLGCPLGIIAGTTGYATLSGCDNAQIEWADTAGVTVTADNTNGAYITVPLATPTGAITISVTCTVTAADGTETVTTEDCETNIIDPAIAAEFECEDLAPISVDFVLCGTGCVCETITINFDCDEDPECEVAYFGITFKDCLSVELEDCEELEAIALEGTPEVAFVPAEFDIEFCCDEVVDRTVDRPAFHWNNICFCDGWELSASNGDSSIYNACSCNAGSSFTFTGSTTITATGPAQLIDSIIIWGHNITDGSISTSPDQVFGGGPTSIGLTSDKSCLAPVSKPIVLSLASPQESTDTVTIELVSNTDDVICIQNLFIGQKLFLPDDMLPQSFVNPHDGTDYEATTKSSNCGRLSRTLKHVEVPMSLELECENQTWIKECWRPYLNYAQRYGVLFQHSRNRCPNDVFYGDLKGPVKGSSSDLCGYANVSIEASGYITQNEIKKFG